VSAPRTADLVGAARVAAALAALTAVAAIAVRLAAADTARRLLGFTFEGVPREPGEAAAIFANNVRVLAAVLTACAMVQVARHRARGRWERALGRGLTAMCDAALAGGCALHVLLVGSAFAAYGQRTLAVVIAHGPFELAAFSLVLQLYLAGRRDQLCVRRPVAVALASTAALAAGAVLEVYA
jgi:hypothetical protein